MLFHEAEGFSWIESGIELMEEHDDIVCVLPRGGPPTLTITCFRELRIIESTKDEESIFSRILRVGIIWFIVKDSLNFCR